MAQVGHKPLNGKLQASLYFYFCTPRKRDTDNFNKLVLDAPTGIVHEDDNWIIDKDIYFRL